MGLNDAFHTDNENYDKYDFNGDIRWALGEMVADEFINGYNNVVRAKAVNGRKFLIKVSIEPETEDNYTFTDIEITF
jgi:hypothetical protein